MHIKSYSSTCKTSNLSNSCTQKTINFPYPIKRLNRTK